MTADVIDGVKLANNYRDDIKQEVARLNNDGIFPALVALQIGDDPSSKIYLENQRKKCEELGINYTVWSLSESTTQKALEDHIKSLNTNPSIHGIILQQPLPAHIDGIQTIQVMAPNKDVEGLHPQNYGKLFYEDHNLAPCTALASEKLLRSYEPNLKGKEIVIIGHSSIVGKPLSMLLLHSKKEAPTVRICHISTKDLKAHTLAADVIFVGCGVPNLIKADMVHKGSIIIDIGINRVDKTDEQGQVLLKPNGKPYKKTVGDVDYEEVSKICKAITPVPGGVGPMTVAMLLNNTIKCACLTNNSIK
ncbi:MAG: bifunctional methylenetetrahydrofolate dehydrogenase/methenyltetrahydrofolate cyclohydrolase [Planctomycetota bacterium]|nr:MAG: bifunctional methylenetetrahydrofolate dehydrogenase/methenyltetrahydrofolate cyclohydrolase [Planctomycetota bacterium]